MKPILLLILTFGQFVLSQDNHDELRKTIIDPQNGNALFGAAEKIMSLPSERKEKIEIGVLILEQPIIWDENRNGELRVIQWKLSYQLKEYLGDIISIDNAKLANSSVYRLKLIDMLKSQTIRGANQLEISNNYIEIKTEPAKESLKLSKGGNLNIHSDLKPVHIITISLVFVLVCLIVVYSLKTWRQRK